MGQGVPVPVTRIALVLVALTMMGGCGGSADATTQRETGGSPPVQPPIPRQGPAELAFSSAAREKFSLTDTMADSIEASCAPDPSSEVRNCWAQWSEGPSCKRVFGQVKGAEVLAVSAPPATTSVSTPCAQVAAPPP